jgi:hypothetical protein
MIAIKVALRLPGSLIFSLTMLIETEKALVCSPYKAIYVHVPRYIRIHMYIDVLSMSPQQQQQRREWQGVLLEEEEEGGTVGGDWRAARVEREKI